MPTYSECPNCGHRFESMLVEAVNSYDVQLSGSEPCPQCGARARLMEGNFSFDGAGNPRMLSGPEWSRELVDFMQQRMREVQRIAQSQSLSDNEARARVERIIDEIAEHNPTVAAEYRKRTAGRSRKVWKITAAAVVGALGVMSQLNTVADFVERVDQIIRGMGA